MTVWLSSAMNEPTTITPTTMNRACESIGFTELAADPGSAVFCEVSVSVDNTKHLNEILDDLKKYGTVTVDKDMCIICVVGDLEWENVGFEAKALDAMRDIPVRMISFGGSNYNISFLIRECDKKVALQSLSDMLFNGK